MDNKTYQKNAGTPAAFLFTHQNMLMKFHSNFAKCKVSNKFVLYGFYEFLVHFVAIKTSLLINSKVLNEVEIIMFDLFM